MLFTAGQRIVFIGDSITDCGWRTDAEKIGQGYVRIVRDYLAVKDAAAAPVVINRGISGNKMPDLEKRWQRDVLDLTPDIVSIYIGINDVWHGLLPGRDGCDIDSFMTGYRNILRRTRAALPGVTLILNEPSALWLSDPPDANDRLGPYVEVVHTLAKEFHAAAAVPLHGAFEDARRARPDIAWTTDGVHPTSTGHMLIAQTWLRANGLT